jgi:predicted nucleotidyltransferase
MNMLTQTIKEYFYKREEVVAVYLFGSHAAGKERRFSDVDIGVILHNENLPQAIALQTEYTVALGRLLRKDVHTVILNTAGELLNKQVYAKGKCVCVNDPRILSLFKMTRYAMIADFDYYLKMTQAGFCRKMMEEHRDG